LYYTANLCEATNIIHAFLVVYRIGDLSTYADATGLCMNNLLTDWICFENEREAMTGHKVDLEITFTSNIHCQPICEFL